MDPYLNEWLNLLIRWLHVIAAIGWIGSSFYFIALDLNLKPPKEQRDVERDVGGELWEVHGGGFYRVEKFRVAPQQLPEKLHWFYWEAYTTWLSGFALLVVLYYVNADAYLIDRGVADLAPIQAVALSVAMLVIGWVVYDVLCCLLEGNDLGLAVVLFLVIVAAAFGASKVFAARAVYIQVGAMIGTWMVWNVFFVVIPGHWALVRAKEEGKEPDPIHGIRGKQRSVHNNYLTLPVLFAMLSNHFPMTYGHPHGWLVLVAMMGISAWLRHFFNLRHQGRVLWYIPASAAAATALLAFLISPYSPFLAGPSAAATGSVDFAQARRIVTQRCTPCHAAQPSHPAFATAPKGVLLETPEQIKVQAQAIHQQAVATRTMPLGNLTEMTQEERDTLGAWIRQGARID